MTNSSRALLDPAVTNNAQWCAAMCRSHGVPGTFSRQAWTAAASTPRYYPDAVTLVPGADPSTLLSGLDVTAAGVSVKDSFADLDLTSAGFRVLFDAEWIYRPADAPVTRSELSWNVVTDPETLEAWARAWDADGDGQDLFRPQLLRETSTVVLAGTSGRRIVAGAVATETEQVVGISNLFAVAGGADAAWPFALAAVRTVFPERPVVGYESGEALAGAVRHGFQRIGALRVWLRP